MSDIPSENEVPSVSAGNHISMAKLLTSNTTNVTDTANGTDKTNESGFLDSELPKIDSPSPTVNGDVDMPIEKNEILKHNSSQKRPFEQDTVLENGIDSPLDVPSKVAKKDCVDSVNCEELILSEDIACVQNGKTVCVSEIDKKAVINGINSDSSLDAAESDTDFKQTVDSKQLEDDSLESKNTSVSFSNESTESSLDKSDNIFEKLNKNISSDNTIISLDKKDSEELKKSNPLSLGTKLKESFKSLIKTAAFKVSANTVSNDVVSEESTTSDNLAEQCEDISSTSKVEKEPLVTEPVDKGNLFENFALSQENTNNEGTSSISATNNVESDCANKNNKKSEELNDQDHKESTNQENTDIDCLLGKDLKNNCEENNCSQDKGFENRCLHDNDVSGDLNDSEHGEALLKQVDVCKTVEVHDPTKVTVDESNDVSKKLSDLQTEVLVSNTNEHISIADNCPSSQIEKDNENPTIESGKVPKESTLSVTEKNIDTISVTRKTDNNDTLSIDIESIEDSFNVTEKEPIKDISNVTEKEPIEDISNVTEKEFNKDSSSVEKTESINDTLNVTERESSKDTLNVTETKDTLNAIAEESNNDLIHIESETKVDTLTDVEKHTEKGTLSEIDQDSDKEVNLNTNRISEENDTYLTDSTVHDSNVKDELFITLPSPDNIESKTSEETFEVDNSAPKCNLSSAKQLDKNSDDDEAKAISNEIMDLTDSDSLKQEENDFDVDKPKEEFMDLTETDSLKEEEIQDCSHSKSASEQTKNVTSEETTDFTKTETIELEETKAETLVSIVSDEVSVCNNSDANSEKTCIANKIENIKDQKNDIELKVAIPVSDTKKETKSEIPNLNNVKNSDKHKLQESSKKRKSTSPPLENTTTKKSRLDSVIGGLASRVGKTVTELKDDSEEIAGSTEADSSSDESENSDDNSRRITITKKKLNTLITTQMEAYLNANHGTIVGNMQNKLDDLYNETAKWKKIAEELSKQVSELTTIPLSERLKAATKTSTRDARIQVDETKLQAVSQGMTVPLRPNGVTPQSLVLGKKLITSANVGPNTTPLTTTGTQAKIVTTSAVYPQKNIENTSPGAHSKNRTVREMLHEQRVVNTTGSAVITSPKGSSGMVVDLTEEDDSPKKANTVQQQSIVLHSPTGAVRPSLVSTALPPGIRPGTYLLQSGPRGGTVLQQLVTAPQPVVRPPAQGNTSVVLGAQGGAAVLLQKPVGQGNHAVLKQNMNPMPPQLTSGGNNAQVMVKGATPQQHNTRLRAPPPLQSAPNTKSKSIAKKRTAPAGRKNSTSPDVMITTVTKPAPAKSHPAPLPPQPTSQSSGPGRKQLPPRPTLKISRVAQGIVLSWNMALKEQTEDITNYQLFAYQESQAPPTSLLWKKVGDVKALPLPMACTLTQFQEGNKYHFSVRAMDKHQRVGPFSEPSSIHLTTKS